MNEQVAKVDRPTGVRLVDADGIERPVVVAYVGETHEGIGRWYVIDPSPGPYAAVRVDVMPPRSELILPLPSGRSCS